MGDLPIISDHQASSRVDPPRGQSKPILNKHLLLPCAMAEAPGDRTCILAQGVFQGPVPLLFVILLHVGSFTVSPLCMLNIVVHSSWLFVLTNLSLVYLIMRSARRTRRVEEINSSPESAQRAEHTHWRESGALPSGV